MLDGAKSCSPMCRKFRCGRNALVHRGNEAWCKWTDEMCNPPNCNYSMCLVRRLLPAGICGETVRRRTSEKRIEEIGPVVKVRGKTYRKIGEKELF